MPFRILPRKKKENVRTKFKRKDYVRMVVREFIEVFLHQIVFLKRIYPETIYCKRRKYRTTLMQSQHPLVNNYIRRMTRRVNRRIQNPKSDKNTLEVNFSKDGEVYQRFRLEIPTVDKCLRSLKRKMLRLSLSTLLRRLAELVRVEYWTYDYEKEEEADGRGWSVRATRSSHESNEDRSYRVVAFRKPVELYLYMERL